MRKLGYFIVLAILLFVGACQNHAYMPEDGFEVILLAGEGTGSRAVEKTNEEGLYNFPDEKPFVAPEGKIFYAWQQKDSQKLYRTGDSVKLNAPTTYVASYRPLVKIQYLPGEGSGSLPDTVLTAIPQDTNYTLPNNKDGFEAPTDKVFDAWSVVGRDGIAHRRSPGYMYKKLNQHLTVTALWKPKAAPSTPGGSTIIVGAKGKLITITFEGGEAVGGKMDSLKHPQFNNFKTPANKPVSRGFVAPPKKAFVGWKVVAADDRDYVFHDLIRVGSVVADLDRDVIFIAQFKDLITVYFEDNNGDKELKDPQKIVTGTSFELPPKSYFNTPATSEFLGWEVVLKKDPSLYVADFAKELSKLTLNDDVIVRPHWKGLEKPRKKVTIGVWTDYPGGPGIVLEGYEGDSFRIPDNQGMYAEYDDAIKDSTQAAWFMDYSNANAPFKKFAGWDIGGTTYQPGDSIKLTESIDLKPVSSPLPFALFAHYPIDVDTGYTSVTLEPFESNTIFYYRIRSYRVPNEEGKLVFPEHMLIPNAVSYEFVQQDKMFRIFEGWKEYVKGESEADFLVASRPVYQPGDVIDLDRQVEYRAVYRKEPKTTAMTTVYFIIDKKIHRNNYGDTDKSNYIAIQLPQNQDFNLLGNMSQYEVNGLAIRSMVPDYINIVGWEAYTDADISGKTLPEFDSAGAFVAPTDNAAYVASHIEPKGTAFKTGLAPYAKENTGTHKEIFYKAIIEDVNYVNIENTSIQTGGGAIHIKVDANKPFVLPKWPFLESNIIGVLTFDSYNTPFGTISSGNTTIINANRFLPGDTIIPKEHRDRFGYLYLGMNSSIKKEAPEPIARVSIVFNAGNNGKGSMGTIILAPGKSYYLPLCEFSPYDKRKRFVGWKLDNTGETLKAGSVLRIDGTKESRTLYAQWE